MFIENYSKFIKYYGKHRKRGILGFFLLSLIAGFFEFVGIALIYPFVLLIVKPESIIHNSHYLGFTMLTHIDNPLINAFILGGFVAFLFIAKNLFMIFNSYLQNKFANNWKLDINKKFMHYYLFSPYKNSLLTSPGEKIYNITFLSSNVIDGFILRGINLITNSIIVLMILYLLFIKFPLAAGITTIFVIFCMLFQNKFFKKRLQEISKRFLKSSSLNNNKTLESINNIKEIKILSAEKHFFDEYLKIQKNYNDILFESNFYGAMPPYIIEILIVLSLLVLGGIISLQNFENISWMLASYAIVMAAIFRIAPSLNRIQTCMNAIDTSRDFVKTMNTEYEKHDLSVFEEKSDIQINFNAFIKLKAVCFSYKKNRQVLKDLDLEIQKGDFVGIIGLSGAGKSTLADILMGLLPIDEGQILVDNLELNQNNFHAMRKLIGYVPQQINILDGSFKRNVAWGVDESEIDEKKVIRALTDARLLDLVQETEDGINANVIIGSNGLSQGQKQRLAIARALYREPEILIFDEATSSLDVETEHEITEMLNKLKGSKTIIAIAHRLSTLKSCNKLIYLKNGKIIDTGTFDELSNRHADFERLIKLSNLST